MDTRCEAKQPTENYLRQPDDRDSPSQWLKSAATTGVVDARSQEPKLARTAGEDHGASRQMQPTSRKSVCEASVSNARLGQDRWRALRDAESRFRLTSDRKHDGVSTFRCFNESLTDALWRLVAIEVVEVWFENAETRLRSYDREPEAWQHDISCIQEHDNNSWRTAREARKVARLPILEMLPDTQEHSSESVQDLFKTIIDLLRQSSPVPELRVPSRSPSNPPRLSVEASSSRKASPSPNGRKRYYTLILEGSRHEDAQPPRSIPERSPLRLVANGPRNGRSGKAMLVNENALHDGERGGGSEEQSCGNGQGAEGFEGRLAKHRLQDNSTSAAAIDIAWPDLDLLLAFVGPEASAAFAPALPMAASARYGSESTVSGVKRVFIAQRHEISCVV
ncbi:uncharacterized protein MYCFIDRAFT_177484 [Pseudocercospora fijiensis CIRAD86]|uniref:Uncharacterized protein n=1 Tax=Pseudocercospora fijiensis (strain CIRAD86) TaxID=383855 RepID=M3A7E5_PSEFD|nr:uncharacterized protein MYCFIDRAFT_177484 [Pseudocercospora fijiensis CIRAD86]EME80541.1 hypothetical protein MYCFIDRAFT_177484 [Pseudocercospora fijiensis CIRAD86]